MGGWCFSVGATFAADYFAYFGLGLIGVQAPLELLARYSQWVIADHWVVLSTSALAGLGIVWMSASLLVRSSLSPVSAVLAVVVVGLFFLLGSQCAHDSAEVRLRNLVDSDFSGMPRVAVWVDATDAPPSLRVELESLSDNCHRLLLENSKALYLIRPVSIVDPLDESRRVLTADSRRPSVLVLPRGGVKAIRILQRDDSCTL